MVHVMLQKEGIHKWSERLHKVAAEIEGIRLADMMYSQLRKIAEGGDFPVDDTKEDGIAIIEKGIGFQARIPSVEGGTENGGKVNLCRQAFPVRRIALLDFFLIAPKLSIGLRESPPFQKVGLVVYFHPDDGIPDVVFCLPIPLNLLLCLLIRIVGSEIGNQLAYGIVLGVAEDDLDAMVHKLRKESVRDASLLAFDDEDTDFVEEYLRFLVLHADKIVQARLELAAVGDADDPESHNLILRNGEEDFFVESCDGLGDKTGSRHQIFTERYFS